MFSVLAFTELYLTLGEISWMSVELFWDYYLLCIMRKGIVICPHTDTSMDNWLCKEGPEVSHERDPLSSTDAYAASFSALHFYPCPSGSLSPENMLILC